MSVAVEELGRLRQLARRGDLSAADRLNALLRTHSEILIELALEALATRDEHERLAARGRAPSAFLELSRELKGKLERYAAERGLPTWTIAARAILNREAGG